LTQLSLYYASFSNAIIAATARSCDAILVHKDSHLAGIPEGLVRQLVLA